MALSVQDINQYKGSLYTSISKNISEFEKNFLLISGAVLAFSITFIKDLVSIGNTSYLPLLFIGWGLIAISVGIIMFTLIRSAYASDEITNYLDKFLDEKEKSSATTVLSIEEEAALKSGTDKIYKKGKATLRVYRYLAISSFLVGLTIFGIFISINLYYENNKKKKENDSPIIKIDQRLKEIQLGNMTVLIHDSLVVIYGKKNTEKPNK